MNFKRNIVLFTGLLLVVSISSCSTEKVEGVTTGSEPNVKHHNVDPSVIANDSLSKKFVPRLSPRELLENFTYCQDHAESELMCKFYTAKAICDYFGINDFKKGEIYLDYEEIIDEVNGDNGWVKIGEATDQKNLEKAQLLANRGKATIAIDIKSKYGHVVLITKGNLEKAYSWKGLLAPSCASFFMVKNVNSFINKSLAYAYSTPEGVYLYTKK